MSIAAAVAALLLVVFIAERMLPLRAVERDVWEWRLRPTGRFPDLDEFSRWQVGTLGVLGGLLGYGTVPSYAGVAVVVGALLTMGVRLLVGVRRVRLPEVLDNGTTRVMFTMSSVLNDSELSANVYAAAWLRKTPVSAGRIRGPVPFVLMWRRLRRRFYIPLLFLVTALVVVALGPDPGLWAQTGLVVAWGVLSSAVWRATRMGVRGELPWRLAFLAAVTVVGTVGFASFWRPDALLLFIVPVVAAILWCAVVRGRPRRNDNFEVTETGMGVAVPLGTVSHLFSGTLAVIPAYLAAVLGS
ncbi:MAG TPA: hypothetical protein H9870_02795 [Candidatus Corynebacterium avicola]|uniref:Uncharacterized protein n=1 Tax=Candidatus Corynebacterium avicola TaxID=2838527 RepID=A0A9D1RLM3_9CORY|nr:hypothetical protein [Candidatus Corynebacterium avicola]